VWAAIAVALAPARPLATCVLAPHTPTHTRSFLIGYWPVYGLLTPLIAAVLFMGLIMASHFIPAW
jgi:hypothetical protein